MAQRGLILSTEVFSADKLPPAHINLDFIVGLLFYFMYFLTSLFFIIVSGFFLVSCYFTRPVWCLWNLVSLDWQFYCMDGEQRKHTVNLFLICMSFIL